jgi:hypothetical protein
VSLLGFLGGLLGGGRRSPTPQPTAIETLRAFPIVVGPSDAQQIAHARYRIDAITRYIDQSAAEGVVIAEAKLHHLATERDMYVAMLKHAKVTP